MMDFSDHAQVAIATPTVAGREVTVPLSSLFRDPLNVRRKGGKSIVELAALIYSQSLLQNLVIREEIGKRKKATGRFGVVAGGRRLEALQYLLSQRKISDDYPVRCLLVSQEDAVSVSLAENCAREPLHGADIFDAFRAMIEQGKTVEQVADAWGISPVTVQKRLKLANVSPKLFALYREDGISLDQLIALTLTDDHATQESVWENTPSYNRSPSNLRQILTERAVDARHPLAIFVGLESYEKAGGSIRRDLFSDDDTGCFFDDAALLERLALERLTEHAETLRTTAGLAWVEARIRFDWSDRRAFTACRTVDQEPTPEQQAQLDALQAQIEALETAYDELDADDDGEAIIAQQEQADAQREAVLAALSVVDPRDQAIVGAVVYIDQHGHIAEARGLVRHEDRAAAEAEEGTATDKQTSEAKPEEKAEFSERLLKQLTANRTAAMRNCLANNSQIAMRVLAYQLTSIVFYSTDCMSYQLDRPVQVRVDTPMLKQDAPDLQESKAQIEFEALRQQWTEKMPSNRNGLLEWILQCDESDVMGLLAFCTASALNTVQGREAPQPTADRIAHAVKLDMADWWAPTEKTYLSSVTKAKILEAVTEAVSAEEAAVLSGLKKDTLVSEAQRKLAGTRWLPKPLRSKLA